MALKPLASIMLLTRMKGPAVKMDLTKPSAQKMILDEIKSGRVSGVMLAPPCGTSSRARNIPLRTASGKHKEDLSLFDQWSIQKGYQGYKG